MHGIVCCIVKKYVETNHGTATWELLLEHAGVPGLVLSPLGIYPDEHVYSLLGGACELLECELDDLLKKIGRFAGPQLIAVAGNMIHPGWGAFELLTNVEGLIHRTIRVQSPEARPGNIQAFRLSDRTLQLIYSSRRNLCPLAKGILYGVGDHYGEDLSVREISCTRQGHPFCTFEVSRATHKKRQEDTEASRFDGSEEFRSQTETRVEDSHLMEQMLSAGKSSILTSDSSQIGTDPTDSRRSKLPIPERLGRYAIHEILGVGGMGVIYRATDETLGRLVAIKTLKSVSIRRELVDMFLEEARAMARINHENVIRVYDVGKIENRPYFVMEYFPGQTLGKRMAKARLKTELAAELFLKILEGVNALHVNGLVHRDIKPDNVMLSLDAKRCLLLDLGLADELCDERDTKRGLGGTCGYMAPERFEGYPADYRSDYFSLGCLAYEMFSGNRAFANESTKSLVNSMRQFNSSSADWRDTPLALQQLVTRMMVLDKQSRLSDYGEIRDTIKAVVAKP